MLDLLRENPDISTGGVLEHFRDTQEGEHLTRLAALGPPVLTEGLTRELSDAFERLLHLEQEHQCDRLLQKSKESVLTMREKQQLRLLLSDRSRGTP